MRDSQHVRAHLLGMIFSMFSNEDLKKFYEQFRAKLFELK